MRVDGVRCLDLSAFFGKNVPDLPPEMSQNPNAKKVLLVDDSDADAYLISHLVEQTEGLELVWRASDGDAALMYLDGIGGFRNRDKFPIPDVVLLDLNMPNRN